MPEIESCCLWGLPARYFCCASCSARVRARSRLLSRRTGTTSEFDPTSGLAMAPSAVCSRQYALVFSQKMIAVYCRLRGGEQRAGDHRIGLGHAAIELFAKAFALPLGAQATILAMSSCGIPRPAGCRTFSRSASLTTKAVLAMDGC